MSAEYNNYLNEHIRNVKRAYSWIHDNLPKVFDGLYPSWIQPVIEAHDDSKISEEEYFAYDNYFYGKKTKEVKEAFDLAWLHHQHNNPHHWQYWVLQEDSGKTRALEMPHEFVIEMVCDWWSFSWKSGNLKEIFDWYANNKKKMTLHPNTLEFVEKILTLMRNKLEESSDDEE